MTGSNLPLDPARLEEVLRPRGEARLLPGEAYKDPAVLAWEIEHLFEPSWVCVGREEDAPEPGDLVTAEVGGECVLLIRGEDGFLRGFYNVCQHRGSRLVEGGEVRVSGPIICPYHSWTYGLDGRLVAAQHMRRTAEFDRRDNGLSPVPTELFGGWVFVNVSGTAGTLASYLNDFAGRLERFDVGSLRRVARHRYEVAANWKLLSENYQECYHCPTIHPELVQVTPYQSGRDDPSEGPWLGGPMDLAPGCNTMSLTGTTERPPIPGLSEKDHSLVFYYTLLPNMWISLHPDYVMTHLVRPLDAERTSIVCEWLFHPDAVDAPGFDPNDAVGFWDRVNRQDWAACERVQRGIGSRGFRGGRFSELENTVHALQALLARCYLEGGVVTADRVGIPVSGSVEDPADTSQRSTA